MLLNVLFTFHPGFSFEAGGRTFVYNFKSGAGTLTLQICTFCWLFFPVLFCLSLCGRQVLQTNEEPHRFSLLTKRNHL